MAYRFTLKQTVAQNARRIALEEVEYALSKCGNEGGDREEIVHDVRKKCKRVRGLIRLLRAPLEADGKYDSDNAFVRDAARELGSVRDTDVMMQTYDKVLGRFHEEVDRRHYGPIRRSLTLHARQAHARDDLGYRLSVFRDRMIEARERIEDWHIAHDGFDLVRDGFARTYRSGRKAMGTAYAEPTAEHFHEWRKHGKYLWYHIRLLEPVWKSEMKARRTAAKELGDILGEYHDISILKTHLAGQNGRVSDFNQLMDRRSVELAAGARILGERLYAARPKAIASEVGGWWQARVDELASERVTH